MNKKLISIVGLVVLVMAVPLIQARIRGRRVEVEVEKLEPRVIQSSVLASGKLVHEEEVKLTTEEIGRVTAIYVEEGEKVKNGELVLQIDDQRLRAAVEQQQAPCACRRSRSSASSSRSRTSDAVGPHAGAARAQAHRRGQLRDGYEQPRDRRGRPESSRESLEQARAQLDQQEDRLARRASSRRSTAP